MKLRIIYTVYMDIQSAKKVFDSLYEKVDGYAISSMARKKLSYFYQGHTYGEVLFDSFFQILREALPKPGEVFYDLGSGTGKALITAALCFDLSKAIGVEILEDLYKASKDAATNLHREPNLSQKKAQQVEFIHSDFHDCDFSDADILFMNATTFQYELDTLMMRKLERLKKGTRVLTTDLPLDSYALSVSKVALYPFSWGLATVYFHEKII